MFIEHIVHNYDNFTLDVQNVELYDNHIIGLVGENGAGKTTLMDVLSQYITANQTFKVKDYNANEVLYIPSDVEPYEYLTVGEFCDIVLSYSSTKMSKNTLLNDMGLQSKEGTLVSQLSQGMKKKLSLINLFISNYSLVILDEPFNSIDLKYSYEIKKTIRSLKKTSTILISSHIIDSLADLCDEFILIEDGIIKKEFKNPENKEILEREIFD